LCGRYLLLAFLYSRVLGFEMINEMYPNDEDYVLYETYS